MIFSGFQFNGQRVRVFAPICSVGAPARPKVKNTTQFNGQYGCDWCLHEGTINNKIIEFRVCNVRYITLEVCNVCYMELPWRLL